jgi:hypothetical protein
MKFIKLHTTSTPILQNSTITEAMIKGKITCFQTFSTYGQLK